MNESWPADRFYWSVMEAPGVAMRAGPVAPWVLATLEDDIPISLEDVWAVGASGLDGSFIVCAARRSELEALADNVESLSPRIVPGFADVEPVQFNLLVGAFEPRRQVRARVRRHALGATAVVVSAALVSVGMQRRAEVWRADAGAARSHAREIIASVAPIEFWTRDDMALELSERQAAAPAEVKPPGDASLALAAIVTRWPTEIRSKAQSISATGDSASLSVTVQGDSAAFLSKLKVPEGWRLEEPRLSGADGVTRITLELRRAAP